MFKEHPFITLLIVGSVVEGVVNIVDIIFGKGKRHTVTVNFGEKNKDNKEDPIDVECKEV